MRIQGERDEFGISPVVGVVMLVALAVILVALVLAMVSGLIPGLQEPATASIEVVDNRDNTVTVQVKSFENADSVIVANESTEVELTSVGQSVDMRYGLGEQITVFGQKDGRRTVLHRQEMRHFATKVWMESSTCDSPGDCNGFVAYNGSAPFPTLRGLNVLELDEQGRFVSYGEYDIHSGDRYRPPATSLDGNGLPDRNSVVSCTNCAHGKLMTHLQNIPDGHYIIIVGDDQPDPRNATVENYLASLGADFGGNSELNYRDSWFFAGIKGHGKLYEGHALRGSVSGVAKVNGTFYAPVKNP